MGYMLLITTWQNFLNSKGIATKVYFYPIHKTHFYKNVLKYKCHLPITEKISDENLALPMYPDLKKEEMDYIIENIKLFFSKN